MELDPALVAVAGALSTVAALYHHSLVRRAEKAEAEARRWLDRYLTAQGLAAMALDEAERRKDP